MDDIEAVKQLKARYFRLLDAKDWDGMRQVCAADIVVDTTASGGPTFADFEDFSTAVGAALAGVVTVHHGHMPEITITSASTATGIWAMEDLLCYPDGARLNGYGHYHETYEKRDGAWQIKTSKLTRLHVDYTAAAAV